MSIIKSQNKVTLNDILFPVCLKKNPRNTNSEYSKVVTGIIDNELMDLNYCSPRYELVKNKDIFPNIETVLNNAGINYSAYYKHIDYVRFYAEYIIEDNRYAYTMKGTSDVIKPAIYVQHSYNGLTKYKINFGYFRLVCENGLTIPVNEMKQFNLSLTGKHTKIILKSFEMLNTMLANFIENAEIISNNITDNYEKLGGVWVKNPKDRIIEVLEASKIGIIDNTKFSTVNNIMETISKETNNQSLGYNGRVNDWLIYNAINQYIDNDSHNKKIQETRRDMDNKVLEVMLS